MNSSYDGIEIVEYPAGTVLFNEGDEGDSAYLVESGLVEIGVDRDGEHLVLGYVGEGDLLGEMAIMDAATRSAGARVVQDARLQVIRGGLLRDRLDKLDPTLRYVFGLMSSRFRSNLSRYKTRYTTNDEARDMDSALKETALGKMRLESDLRAAVDKNSLSVYYQPIVHLADGRLAGFESLLRWHHPSRGMVMPVRFIQLAEETPLIAGIGLLVVDQVIDQLPRIRQAIAEGGVGDPEDFFIGVNVSASQLDAIARFQEMAERLRSIDMPVGCIKLEITESQLAEAAPVMAWAREVKRHGFQVVIDDFGTGYSSLSQLIKLQADTLKIDKSFVDDMLQSKQAESMIRAIVSIARVFNMTIVAEGIETEAQRRMLADLGCEYGQGFLFAKPMPLEDVLAWCARPGL